MLEATSRPVEFRDFEKLLSRSPWPQGCDVELLQVAQLPEKAQPSPSVEAMGRVVQGVDLLRVVLATSHGAELHRLKTFYFRKGVSTQIPAQEIVQHAGYLGCLPVKLVHGKNQKNATQFKGIHVQRRLTAPHSSVWATVQQVLYDDFFHFNRLRTTTSR